LTLSKQDLTYTSYLAFDFLVTPMCRVWCAARLNRGCDLTVGDELSALHLIAY